MIWCTDPTSPGSITVQLISRCLPPRENEGKDGETRLGGNEWREMRRTGERGGWYESGGREGGRGGGGLSFVPSLAVWDEHPIKGNESGGGGEDRDEGQIKASDASAGLNMMRCLQGCMDVLLSRNQCVSVVSLQPVIQSFLPVVSASALQQPQVFTAPYWKKPQGASCNLHSHWSGSLYCGPPCSATCYYRELLNGVFAGVKHLWGPEHQRPWMYIFKTRIPDEITYWL